MKGVLVLRHGVTDMALPLLPILAPLILKKAPKLIRTIAGDKAGGIADTVAGLVTSITGVGDVNEAVKKIEADPNLMAEFETRIRTVEAEVEKAHLADRQDARAREIAIRDNTPKVLAYATTVGFFAVLTGLMLGIGDAQYKDALYIMLGSLGTAWTAQIAYYFGSSSGSKMKDELRSLSK